MKKTLKMLVAVAFVAIVAFALVGCGGPESLAKQSYNLYKDIEKAGDDPKKIEELTKKSLDLQAKIEKLSDDDKKKYQAAVEKLFDGE